MRRALAWVAAALLMVSAAVIVGQLRPDHNTISFTLPAPKAAYRADKRMPLEWPAGQVDPNTDDLGQLMLLDGIGPELAQRILDERMTNGPFIYPEDLLNVRGIGVKTFEKLRHQIRLSPPNNQ